MSDSEMLERGRKIAGEIGLNLHRVWGDQVLPKYYHEDDIHRLLGAGASVFCHDICENDLRKNPNLPSKWYHDPVVDASQGAKRKALLIGIRPIKQESEEQKLLREMVDFGMTDKSWSFYERAKALLNEESK